MTPWTCAQCDRVLDPVAPLTCPEHGILLERQGANWGCPQHTRAKVSYRRDKDRAQGWDVECSGSHAGPTRESEDETGRERRRWILARWDSPGEWARPPSPDEK